MDPTSASVSFSEITSSLTGYLSSLLPRGSGRMASSPYLPEVNDVLSVKDIFSDRLPLEIIDSIIDFAEYWPHISARRERKMVVSGSSGAGENREYLRTPPLCYDMSQSNASSPPLLPSRTIHPCRKIIFSISSKDQGFGGSHQHHGTFEQSYTWFDVVREPWSPPESHSTEEPTHPFLPGAKTLQKNKLAHKEPIKHDITWSYLDNLDPDSDEAQELAAKLGRGRGTMNGEFVRQMKAGDSIALWARARFPAWKNYIYEAEVKVFWAV